MIRILDFRNKIDVLNLNSGQGCAPEIGDIQSISVSSNYGSGLANGIATYSTVINAETHCGEGKPVPILDYNYNKHF